MNKISFVFLPLIFFVFISSPFINDRLKIVEFERKSENRTFRDSLEFNISRLDPFPLQCNEYINDNFSFRTPLLQYYNSIKYKYLKVSTNPKKTLIGKDEWFFLGGKEKNIFEGKLNFSEEHLGFFKKEWSDRQRYFNSKKIKFYWLIAPFKHRVYDHKMPSHILPSENRRTGLLIEHLRPVLGDKIIDPFDDLVAERDQTNIYRQLDNHWSPRSGERCANLVLDAIRKDFPSKNVPEIPQITWIDSLMQSGIHHSVIGIDELSENIDFPEFQDGFAKKVERYGFPSIPGFAYGWEYEHRYKNDSIKNGLTALVIRDSFGDQIIPFLNNSFSEVVYIFDAWQYNVNEEIIDVVQPDVVIFLGLETHTDAIISKYLTIEELENKKKDNY